LLLKCICATRFKCFFTVCSVCTQSVRVDPEGAKEGTGNTHGSYFSVARLDTGSRYPSLSGRDGRAGEQARAARGVQAEGAGRGGGGGRRLAGAAQVSVVELPQQLLVLHRQTLVHLGLLLERLVQRRLLRRQLPATQRHNVRNTPSRTTADRRRDSPAN